MRTAERHHEALVPSWIAAAAAACAAALLQAASLAVRAPEGVAEALWLLGWAFAVWAAIAVAVSVVLLWRRRARPAGPSRASAALVTAALLLLATSAWLHPLVGSGSGTG